MASSPVRSETKFMKRLKDVLKIKRRKNIDYSAKTGTKIPNKKFASFREDTKKNKKLQQEAKDPRQNIRTYDRVTSKNKSKFSDQQKVKSKKTTKKKSGTRTPAGMVRYKGRLVSTRTAQGKAAMNRLKAKKRAQEMAKKRLGK
tara:strand:+ start:56 stop:487 length:432 start_codon:yes stop_codon:yes gene_type:complete